MGSINRNPQALHRAKTFVLARYNCYGLSLYNEVDLGGLVVNVEVDLSAWTQPKDPETTLRRPHIGENLVITHIYVLICQIKPPN